MVDSCRLYRNLYDIIHPSISRKNISNYKIIFNDKYIISQNTFGASGKKEDVLKKFGFDVETLEKRIENLL